MGIDDQIDKFDDLIEFVRKELPKYAQRTLAGDVAALVINRVTLTGKNYKGQPFKPYSKNAVAAYKFWGKSRTQTAENKVRKLSRARSALSYSEFRELNNLPVNKKTFDFTTEMWRKFGFINADVRADGAFKISLGGQNTSAQKKIDENTAREGISIIEASGKEERIAQQATKDWITAQANRILS